MESPKFDGPIPGENYTSDTRNYPWHRPPKNTDYVSSVEHMLKRLAEPEKSAFALTMLEEGETVLDFVAGTLRLAVSQGGLSIDNAVLAAGPYARAVESLAKKAGIKYEKGWSDKPRLITSEAIRDAAGRRSVVEAPAEEATAEEPGGFAAVGNEPADQDIQAEMLGMTSDEDMA